MPALRRHPQEIWERWSGWERKVVLGSIGLRRKPSIKATKRRFSGRWRMAVNTVTCAMFTRKRPWKVGTWWFYGGVTKSRCASVRIRVKWQWLMGTWKSLSGWEALAHLGLSLCGRKHWSIRTSGSCNGFIHTLMHLFGLNSFLCVTLSSKKIHSPREVHLLMMHHEWHLLTWGAGWPFSSIVLIPSSFEFVLINSFISQEDLSTSSSIVAVKQEDRRSRQGRFSQIKIVAKKRNLVGSTIDAKLADGMIYVPPTPFDWSSDHRVIWIGPRDDLLIIHVEETEGLLGMLCDQVLSALPQSFFVQKLMKYFFGLSMKESDGEHEGHVNSDRLIPGDVDGEGWNGFGEGRWVLTNHLPIIIGEDKAFVWTILVPSRCFGEVTKLFHPETDFFGVVSLVNDLFEFLSEFTNEELMP